MNELLLREFFSILFFVRAMITSEHFMKDNKGSFKHASFIFSWCPHYKISRDTKSDLTFFLKVTSALKKVTHFKLVKKVFLKTRMCVSFFFSLFSFSETKFAKERSDLVTEKRNQLFEVDTQQQQQLERRERRGLRSSRLQKIFFVESGFEHGPTDFFVFRNVTNRKFELVLFSKKCYFFRIVRMDLLVWRLNMESWMRTGPAST